MNDQPSPVPTTTTKNTEEIQHQSVSLINKVNENMIDPQQQQSIGKSECIKIKSRKSKEKCNVFKYSSR